MIRLARYRLARILRSAARRVNVPPGDNADSLSAHSADVRASTRRHDMMSDPDESYYADQYMGWINEHWSDDFSMNPRVLDIGCGQGRLSLRVATAAKASRVVGVDFSPEAIDVARGYATTASVHNAEFAVSDALAFVEAQEARSFDLILMTEVTFYLPTYQRVIEESVRILRPGGKIVISFRSQYFDLLHLIQHRRWDDLDLVIRKREGFWDDSWFSWHTPEDIRQLLSTVGLIPDKLYGIGPFSGIEGDPLCPIARPALLWPEERKRLFDAEKVLAEQYACAGRYILAFCEKPALA